jgi:hypothetical protein
LTFGLGIIILQGVSSGKSLAGVIIMGSPAFQKPLGVVERAYICNPSGIFRSEQFLKVLSNLKNL